MAPDRFEDDPPGRRRPSQHWNWLLALPIVLPLLTVVYNRDTPHLFGFPAFYWFQFAFVIVGVASTTIVYQMTKDRD